MIDNDRTALTQAFAQNTMTQTFACNSNWLDYTPATGSGANVSNCTVPFNGYYQTPWYYPVYYTTKARPIKLTMSEVERLRKAAKADDEIKAILSKFTSQIEITVDFE